MDDLVSVSYTHLYSFKGGFGVPTRMPKIASSYDHARLMNDAWRNKEMSMGNDPGMYGVYTEDELQKFRDGSDPVSYTHLDVYKRQALIHKLIPRN